MTVTVAFIKRGRKPPTTIQSTNFKVQEKYWSLNATLSFSVTDGRKLALFTNDSQAVAPLTDKYSRAIIGWPIQWAD